MLIWNMLIVVKHLRVSWHGAELTLIAKKFNFIPYVIILLMIICIGWFKIA